MKKTLRFLIFFLIYGAASAQDISINISETPIYRVYYEHAHIRDTTRRDSVYRETMLLSVGKTHAQFVSFDKLQEYIVTRKKVLQELDMGKSHIDLKPGKVIIPEEVIISYQNQALVDNYIGRHYIYPQSLPPITWVLTDSSKTIENIPCHQATSSYAGRKWTAWFAPEIAVPAGPWFLRGLPGLILEAYDEEKEVVYAFSRLESTDIGNELLDELPAYKKIQLTSRKSSVFTSKADFEKKAAEAKADYRTFVERVDKLLVENLGGGFDFGINNKKSWVSPIPNPIGLENL